MIMLPIPIWELNGTLLKIPVPRKMMKAFRRRATSFALEDNTIDRRPCQDHDDFDETSENDGLTDDEEDQN